MLRTDKVKLKVNKKGNNAKIIFGKPFKAYREFSIWKAFDRQSTRRHYERLQGSSQVDKIGFLWCKKDRLQDAIIKIIRFLQTKQAFGIQCIVRIEQCYNWLVKLKGSIICNETY